MENRALFRELVGARYRESVGYVLAALLGATVLATGSAGEWIAAGTQNGLVLTVAVPLSFYAAYRNGGLLVAGAVFLLPFTLAGLDGRPLWSVPLLLLIETIYRPPLAFVPVVIYAAARTLARRAGRDPLGPLDRALFHRDRGVLVVSAAIAAVFSGLLVAPVSPGAPEPHDIPFPVYLVVCAFGLAVYDRGGGYLGAAAIGGWLAVPHLAAAVVYDPLMALWRTVGLLGGLAAVAVAAARSITLVVQRLAGPSGSLAESGRPVNSTSLVVDADATDATAVGKPLLSGAIWWLALVPVAAVEPPAVAGGWLSVGYAVVVLAVFAVAVANLLPPVTRRWGVDPRERPARTVGAFIGFTLLAVVVSAV